MTKKTAKRDAYRSWCYRGCLYCFRDQNEKGEVIYGRNFDFLYAPSLQLYTEPKNGYKSVSTVNLSFAGYSENFLPDGSLFDKFLTLAAPFLPFDGMNEKEWQLHY